MAIYFHANKALGLEGIVTDDIMKGKGATEVSSMQFGVGNSVHISKGGVEKGSPSLSEITITKNFDKMSLALFKASLLGSTIPTCQLDFVAVGNDAKAGSVLYLTYKMTNAVVSGYSTSSGGDKPSESVSLAYEEIEVTYHTPPVEGKNTPGDPVVQKWSIVKNTAA